MMRLKSFLKISNFLFFLAVTCFILTCKEGDLREENETDDTNVGEQIYPIAQVVIYGDDTVRISRKAFGVNNYWTNITADEFHDFNNKLDELGYTLLRFPGGWESEHYDWINNATPGWEKQPEQPGATADQTVEYAPSVSFVVRTIPYLNDPTESNLKLLLTEAENLVRSYGAKVNIWEIGNEWFLVNKSNRSEYLKKYARLAKVLVGVMKSINPDIQIFIGCDWTQPDDMEVMKDIIGPEWDHVDGINIHIYAGDVDVDHHLDSIQPRIGSIKKITSKSQIYVSEWNAAKAYTDQKRHLMATAIQMQVLFQMIRSGIVAASIWPPAEGIEGLNLIDSDFNVVYPSGQGFKWMTESFSGNALRVENNVIPAIASKTDQDRFVVFLFGMAAEAHEVHIKLHNADISNLISAEVMYSMDPDEKLPASLRNISTSVTVENGGEYLKLVINPGGFQRGKDWEILRVVFI